MAVNRLHFRSSFQAFSNWHCPRCATGFLDEDSAARVIIEPKFSNVEHNEDWWEPEHIVRRFSAFMHCSNDACGECVVVVGKGGVSHLGYDDDGDHYADNFTPSAAYPTIPIFRLSADWPELVRIELELAFSAYWSDLGAAASRLRIAVEQLLTEMGVRRIAVVSKDGIKKRKSLTLHQRIEEFRVKDQKAADLLMAIKWLGNIGSHAHEKKLTRDGLLDGMEIMEHVLHHLYDDRAKSIAMMATNLNKTKGKAATKRPLSGVSTL